MAIIKKFLLPLRYFDLKNGVSNRFGFYEELNKLSKTQNKRLSIPCPNKTRLCESTCTLG
jgi:hypothetical protein